MSARQLIILAIAFVAAIGALLLIRGMGAQDPQPEAPGEAIAGEQVLVAAKDVPQGAALTDADLVWRLFPTDSVSSSFIRGGDSAPYVGAVTRRAFAEGEPITTGSVVQPESRGFMAAQLLPGYRAVAVEIESQTAAGGFIQPNDRVDVILTRSIGEGENERVRSDVVLQDVRILALDDAVQAQSSGEGPEQIAADVAVLELSAEDARALAMADAMGGISLALRGVEAEPPGYRAPSAARAGMSQQGESVRIHAFGSVSGGGGT